MFRRAGVINGDDGATSPLTHQPAESIVRVQVSRDPATAMEEHQHGKRPLAWWRVEAQRQ